MRIHVGAVLGDQGSAIVVTEHRILVPHDPNGRDGRDAVVRGIERPGGGFQGIADRLAEIAWQAAGDEPVFLVDADSGGHALWDYLVGERKEGRFPSARWPWEWEKTGRARQELVDRLVVATHKGALRFAGNLANQSALDKAMVAYRRKVDDDGLIGSELVIALGLTLLYPRYGPQPRVLGKDGQVYGSLAIARSHGTHVAY